MLVLAFATYLEAEATISSLNAIAADEGVWQFSKGQVIVTGMGIMKATISLCRHLHATPHPKALWHLGFAGALQGQAIGTVHEIGKILRLPPWPRCDATTRKFFTGSFPPYGDSPHGATLVSVDAPLHHAGIRRRLSTQADLIDMEGYSAAAVASSFQLPWRQLKVVSDSARSGGRGELQRRAAEFSASLAVWIGCELQKF